MAGAAQAEGSWHTQLQNYSLSGRFQGPGGSAQAQNLAKWSFHVGWEQGKSSVTLAALLSPSRVNKVSRYQCIYLFPAPFGDL